MQSIKGTQLELDLSAAPPLQVGDRVWIAHIDGPRPATITGHITEPFAPGYIWEVQIEGQKGKFPYKAERLHRSKAEAEEAWAKSERSYRSRESAPQPVPSEKTDAQTTKSTRVARATAAVKADKAGRGKGRKSAAKASGKGKTGPCARRSGAAKTRPEPS